MQITFRNLWCIDMTEQSCPICQNRAGFLLQPNKTLNNMSHRCGYFPPLMGDRLIRKESGLVSHSQFSCTCFTITQIWIQICSNTADTILAKWPPGVRVSYATFENFRSSFIMRSAETSRLPLSVAPAILDGSGPVRSSCSAAALYRRLGQLGSSRN